MLPSLVKKKEREREMFMQSKICSLLIQCFIIIEIFCYFLEILILFWSLYFGFRHCQQGKRKC